MLSSPLIFPICFFVIFSFCLFIPLKTKTEYKLTFPISSLNFLDLFSPLLPFFFFVYFSLSFPPLLLFLISSFRWSLFSIFFPLFQPFIFLFIPIFTSFPALLYLLSTMSFFSSYPLFLLFYVLKHTSSLLVSPLLSFPLLISCQFISLFFNSTSSPTPSKDNDLIHVCLGKMFVTLWGADGHSCDATRRPGDLWGGGRVGGWCVGSEERVVWVNSVREGWRKKRLLSMSPCNLTHFITFLFFCQPVPPPLHYFLSTPHLSILLSYPLPLNILSHRQVHAFFSQGWHCHCYECSRECRAGYVWEWKRGDVNLNTVTVKAAATIDWVVA